MHEGDDMAVLSRNTVVGMTTDAYDQVALALAAQLKTQPGFVMHVAYPGPGWAHRGRGVGVAGPA